jgi:hypothetical protein
LSIVRTPTPDKTKKITIAVSATLAVAAAGGIATAVGGHGAAAAVHPVRPVTTAGVNQVRPGAAPGAATWPGLTFINRSQVDAVAAVHTPAVRATVRRTLSPRQLARQMLPSFGWPASQFGYLSLLWYRESGWQVSASNPATGAYGIPQAVPGSKMASAGADWVTSARTQIRWGLRYIKAQYGSPYLAWQHELAAGWY